MLYVTYDDFFEYVLPEVHGCPKAIARTAIRDAVIEFCDRSHIWTEPSEKTDIMVGFARYAFDVRTANAVVATVRYASINDNPIEIVAVEDLNRRMHWRTLEQKVPTMCFMDTNETLRLVGIPTEDIEDGLYIEVALKPDRISTECPKFLHEKWATEIAHGALAKLKAMVGRVWANPAVVSFHRAEFRAGVSRAKSAAQKSHQTLSRTMSAQNFLEL